MTVQIDDVIPEIALTATLSPQWQGRFHKAIKLLRSQLDKPFNWQEISQHCATSPNHFHVMFRTIFGETPATYHRRMRLKQVLFELHFELDKSVSDIALDAGFSTSQSLAKVLKRELNLSANQIRQQNINTSFNTLRSKVEHVIDGTSLELNLSKNITFSIITQEERYLYLECCNTVEVTQVTNHWLTIAPIHVNDSVSVSPWEVIENARTPYQIGYYCEQAQANYTLTKQQFLTCRVNVVDDTAYIACWEALLYHAMQQGYRINESYGLLEHCHNPRDIESFTSDITLMLAIDLE